MVDMALGYADAAKYVIVQNEIVDHTRWGIVFDLVFMTKDDERYWYKSYQVGATECQDEGPFDDEGDTVECQEVAPYEVSIIKYRVVEDDED
jgi:hypothetical protein